MRPSCYPKFRGAHPLTLSLSPNGGEGNYFVGDVVLQICRTYGACINSSVGSVCFCKRVLKAESKSRKAMQGKKRILFLFWTAATRRRFQSADTSAHSKASGGIQGSTEATLWLSPHQIRRLRSAIVGYSKLRKTPGGGGPMQKEKLPIRLASTLAPPFEGG
jgi:hypothetical protein